MTRKVVLAALVVALIAPTLVAQTPRPRRTPRPEARAFSFSFSGNRARIGVIVNTVANAETDRLGAKLDGITPGGPAEKAGLKAGDIITRFNATSLAGVPADDEDESGPGRKLIELVGDLDPGDTVRVEYRRGSDSKTATLVTDEHNTAWSLTAPELAHLEFPERSPMAALTQPGFAFCFGDAWCDLDLVTLSPELGEYFGTREGILVVKSPSDSALPLKGGDVILSIGGRKPSTPAHAMRILRSYDAGETVSIEIMRHERRQTLSWTVPREDTRWKVRSPRGRGEQSFWFVQPQIERATMRSVRRQLEAARRNMRDLLRSRIDGRLLRSGLGRARTVL